MKGRELVPAAATVLCECARTVTLLGSFVRRLLGCDLQNSRQELKVEQLRWLSPPELTALLVGDTTAMVRKAGSTALSVAHNVGCCWFGGMVLAAAIIVFLSAREPTRSSPGSASSRSKSS